MQGDEEVDERRSDNAGEHMIRGWSTTQAVIALSSGEAEYYGMARGTSLARGVRSLMNDLGEEAGAMLMTGASAAIGIAKRRGLGKVRHLEMSQMWLQEQVEAKHIDIRKVRLLEDGRRKQEVT